MVASTGSSRVTLFTRTRTLICGKHTHSNANTRSNKICCQLLKVSFHSQSRCSVTRTLFCGATHSCQPHTIQLLEQCLTVAHAVTCSATRTLFDGTTHSCQPHTIQLLEQCLTVAHALTQSHCSATSALSCGNTHSNPSCC